MVKLAYGLKNNKLIHIDNVNSGLLCNCICPACNSALIAKKGNKAHHFAHQPEINCEHAYESFLHIAAKEIINKGKKLILPELIAYVRSEIDGGGFLEEKKLLREKSFVTVEDIDIEKRINNFIPDLLANADNTPLIIEVAYSHFCDLKKIQKIMDSGISAIEIDLSHLAWNTPYDVLAEEVLSNAPRKWLFSNKQIRYENEVLLPILNKNISEASRLYWQHKEQFKSKFKSSNH